MFGARVGVRQVVILVYINKIDLTFICPNFEISVWDFCFTCGAHSIEKLLFFYYYILFPEKKSITV